jgi:hypothetical protein
MMMKAAWIGHQSWWLQNKSDAIMCITRIQDVSLMSDALLKEIRFR